MCTLKKNFYVVINLLSVVSYNESFIEIIDNSVHLNPLKSRII